MCQVIRHYANSSFSRMPKQYRQGFLKKPEQVEAIEDLTEELVEDIFKTDTENLVE